MTAATLQDRRRLQLTGDARWLVVATHVIIVVIPVVFAGTGFPIEMNWTGLLLTVPLGVAIVTLQLRTSVALARGERPEGRLWTLPVLAAAIYGPLPWLGLSWINSEVFLIAAIVMLLPRRIASALVVLWLVARQALILYVTPDGAPAGALLFNMLYNLGGPLALAGALVGSVWLVRTLDELHTARSEVARMAVERERLRLSRDVHDLLGQSLSAVSLKGDLAVRLLRSDTAAAQLEIEDLTALARDALHGMRAVTSGKHAVSLRGEADSAAKLLLAAGVATEIDIDVADVSPAAERVLAWAVREGVTNLLRHSDPRTVSITALCQDDTVRLEVVNDAAHPPAPEGRGLAGLRERAREVSGTVSAHRSADGRFQLVLEIPREAS